MTQLGLDLTPHRTHAGDPASSHIAEARIRESGAMAAQIATVERLLLSCTGSTAKTLTREALRRCEPALASNFHECHSQIMRRLSDLKNQKRARRQSTPGQDQVRWFHTGE